MDKEIRNRKDYISPDMMELEIEIMAIICQSNTEKPTDGTPGWDWVN